MSSSAAWPPKQGVTTPTVSRKEAVLSASASTRISAPASVVFETLTNIAQYPQWNTSFCPEASIASQPSSAADDKTHLHKDTVANFKFAMNETKTADAQCTVTDVSTPDSQSDYIAADILSEDPAYSSDLANIYRLAWKQVGSGLTSERFHEVIIISDKECEVRTWACWSGMLARGMKWGGFGGKIEAKMQAYVGDIKKRAEQQANGGD